MSAPLDLTKLVQTRDGRPARIICTDRKDEAGRSIVVLVLERGGETMRSYHADGRMCAKIDWRDDHLINAPVKREGWVNIYANGMMDSARPHPTRDEADRAMSRIEKPSRSACVRVEWEEPA